MSTSLLPDDEYNYIQAQFEEITNKIATASPRAAAHYGRVAKLHGDFLAKEESKRVLRQVSQERRNELAQRYLARRIAALEASQQRAHTQEQ